MQNMAETLSSNDIEALCDVAQKPAPSVNAEKIAQLRRLADAGFIKRKDEEAQIYELTGKGQKVLTDRGAGLNEA